MLGFLLELAINVAGRWFGLDEMRNDKPVRLKIRRSGARPKQTKP